MKSTKQIAEETIAGMTPAQQAAAAHDLEEIARIIRAGFCDSCAHCALPYCSLLATWQN